MLCDGAIAMTMMSPANEGSGDGAFFNERGTPMHSSRVWPLLCTFVGITTLLLLVATGFGNVDAPRSLKGTGFNIGDTAFDFTGIDQFGNQSSLYDLYGQFVVFDYCAAWCLPCRLEARDGLLIQPINNVKNQGVHVRFMQVLLQDTSARPATSRTVQAWIGTFHLDYPVWRIPDADYGMVFDQFLKYGVAGGSADGAFPTHVVLGPDLKIIGLTEGTVADPTISSTILTSFQTTPAYMVFNIVAQIDDYQLSHPTTLSLEGELKAAISILTDQTDVVESPQDRFAGACHSLNAFVDRLTKSDELNPAQIAQLSLQVQQVQAALSCGAQPN
jgi:AhpC/TSA family